MGKVVLLILVLSLIGCNSVDKDNGVNKNHAYELEMSAQKSRERISELPLGFEFGMSNEEVNNLLAFLSEKKNLEKSGDYFYYFFPAQCCGKNIKSRIGCDYYNDELYKLSFSFGTAGFNIDSLECSISKYLNNNLDTLYKKASFYDKIDEKTIYNFSYWVKGNQIIFLRKDCFGAIDLSYINAPIEKAYNDIQNEIYLEEARERSKKLNQSKVENSSWDGSVKQVRKYLKKNLKAPDSYKSIEWGKVIHTENGYMVRHKYRAKNSFGAYIMEDKIFYLNKSGDITLIQDYK